MALAEVEALTGNGNGSGSIGEWVARQVHEESVLNENKREEGYDGRIGKRKIEIKLHASMKRTNIKINQLNEFDDLIVVIHRRSQFYREEDGEFADFQIYYFKDFRIHHEVEYIARNFLIDKEYNRYSLT